MAEEFRLEVPVVLNFFNREDTVWKVFESIRMAKPSKLYLVSDGARKGRTGEAEKVRELREKIEEGVDWECKIYKNYADENLGCGKRIESGYNWVFEQEEMAILLEDDTLPVQSFYRYAQELLLRYKDDERVMVISGNNLLQNYHTEKSYIFSRYASMWGWATWARAWNCYEGSIEAWAKICERKAVEQYYGKRWGKIYSEVIEWGYTGKVDTWDWQWEATRFWNYGLCIIPRYNMVRNIGFESMEATHTTGKNRYDFNTKETLFPLKHPETVLPELEFDKQYLKKVVPSELSGRTFPGKIKGRIKRLLSGK